MKHLHCIILIVIIAAYCSACNDTPKNTPQQAKHLDTGKMKDTVPALPVSDEVDPPAYTDPVYKPYISDELRSLIEEKLPGWRLPPSSSWEKYWFDSYKKAGALVDHVSADFNGDGKADHALLLENENHAFIVWVLQSQNNGYKTIELTELTEATLPLNTGLELVPKGKLNHLSLEDNEDAINTVELKHPGIQVVFFEASAETYYWKDGKYRSVVTGD